MFPDWGEGGLWCGTLEEMLSILAQAVCAICLHTQTNLQAQTNQTKTSPSRSHIANKTNGKEIKKPNGKNSPKRWQRDAQKSKAKWHKCPKCDFPVPLDLWLCPKPALQMELPFIGRTPQIGIKAPHVGTEVPPNRQGQRGPGMHPGDWPNSWWVCHGASKALFLILQKLKSSQRTNLG